MTETEVLPSISVSEVSKIFRLRGLSKPKVAVDSVTFNISAGERIGIIGPNGAGKTTLLQILSGIIEPTSGHIDVEGKITTVLTLGVALREEASGIENIYMDGEAQGLSRTRVDSYLDEVSKFSELGEFLKRPVRTYSTGMKSRLSFAMLMAAQPEILIIDEALSAGDVFFARKATRKMRELTARGKISIIVSHSLDSIRQMCDRVLWMENGAIRADGPADEVLRNYEQTARESDTKAWEALHRQLRRVRSTAPEWALEVTSFSQAGETGLPHCLKSGQTLGIHFGVTKPAGKTVTMRYQLEKSDGLKVDSGTLGEFPGKGLKDSAAELCFDPLLLASGIYIIHGGLYDGDEEMAGFTEVIEVMAPKFPGGAPLLICPPYAESTRIS